MKPRAVLVLVSLLGLAAAAALFAQQRSVNPVYAYEMFSVFPRETSAGQYQQVDQHELQNLAEQGWELVSVAPFVYRNEERNNGDMHGPKPVVTQTYPAYFFKRPRISRY